MKTNKHHIIILGLGNPILMDDGIGPMLCNDMKKLFPLPNIEYKVAAVGGIEVLELISGFDTVIIIDAIRTKNGIPGIVYHLSPSDFKETSNISNLHDVSFLTALELGKRLGIKIPENIHIIAVEIVEDRVFAESLTPELQSRYDEIKQTVKIFVESIILQIWHPVFAEDSAVSSKSKRL